MKTLLVICPVPPYDTLCRILYLYEYLNAGIEVKFWNVCELCYPGADSSLQGEPAIPQVVFDSKDIFLEELSKVDPRESLCELQFNAEEEAHFIYQAVKEYGFTTSYMYCRPLPLGFEDSWDSKIKQWVRHPMATFQREIIRRFFSKTAAIGAEIPDYCIPDYLFNSSELPPPHVSERTKLVKYSTMEYECFLRERHLPVHPLGKGACVFLDQSFVSHPDHANFDPQRRPTKEESESYLATMTHIFDKIENELDLPVVIAAHPKASYAGGEFGDRPIVQNKTFNLVAGASLVVAHYSLSVTYAICFKKPLLFVTTREQLKRVYGNASLAYLYAKVLGAGICTAENALPRKFKMPCVNSCLYDRFLFSRCSWKELEGQPAAPMLIEFVKNL